MVNIGIKLSLTLIKVSTNSLLSESINNTSVKIGGSGWIRTTDLTLIRGAL